MDELKQMQDLNELLDPKGPLLSQFSISGLIAAFIFGIVGLWLFRRGKSKSNSYHLWIGVILMIYPYFTPNATFDWLIGLGLCWAAYYYRFK